MKLSHKIIPRLATMLLSIVVLLLIPIPVQAALSILSVSPHTISNTQVNYLTITGSDFQTGAIASLSNYGNLFTTFFSTTTLFAEVPAGLSVGLYSVTVINPDSTSSTLPDALTVIDQPIVPTATVTPSIAGYERPVMVVLSYSPSSDRISPGDPFSLSVTIYNAGQNYATNVMAIFATGTLIPRSTGGVVAVGDVAPNNRADFSQPVVVSTDFWGSLATGDMTLTYTDQSGNSYSEHFTITIPIYYSYSPGASPTPTATVTPTPTPAPSHRPQLIIPSYTTDITPLQPGDRFSLSLNVSNTGNAAAKRISMIIGGGSASSSGYGTPDTSGISGAGGEFTNFAPIGSSNVQSLGDLAPGAALEIAQTLIVNVSTNPGAYPMRISFVYVDENNHPYVDEQVITLLVYRLPKVEFNFYRDPGSLFSGQENILPIQIVNLGRNSVILGNMQVNAVGGQLSNNTILIGTLETGGYFTLDANFIPDTPGTYELVVSVDYLNDFNQSQVISQILTVEVLDIGIIEPEINGGMNEEIDQPVEQPETFLHKMWRFILGFLGLDSSLNSGQGSTVEPYIEEPVYDGAQPVPLKGP
jgi:hypothetical protein